LRDFTRELAALVAVDSGRIRTREAIVAECPHLGAGTPPGGTALAPLRSMAHKLSLLPEAGF
jgi:hypothetical protein